MTTSKPRALGVHIYSGAWTLGFMKHFSIIGQWEEFDSAFGATTFELNFPNIVHPTSLADWPIAQTRGNVEVVYANPPCVIEGSNVSSTSDVLGVTKRVYEGEVVELKLVSGDCITVTPNHPILTDKGWVAASFLKQGDNVICGPGSDRGTPGCGDEQDAPTRVEDLFDALRIRFGGEVLMLGGAEDFHGDGRDGEIHVVPTNRFLRDWFEAAFDKELIENAFVKAAEVPLSLTREGGFDKRSLFVSAPDLKRSGVARHFSAALGRILDPPIERSAGFMLASDGYRVLFEDAADVVPANLKFPTKLSSAGSELVATDELRRVNRLERAQISQSAVASAVIKSYVGHVYNLHTESNYYYVGNIITHNCACWSLTGKRLNAADDRVQYTKRSFDVAMRLEPEIFVMESVPQAWSPRGGREVYQELVERATRSGYQVTILLTNAILHGAPQSRERFHFIAHRRELNLRTPTPSISDMPTIADVIQDLEHSAVRLGETPKIANHVYKPQTARYQLVINELREGEGWNVAQERLVERGIEVARHRMIATRPYYDGVCATLADIGSVVHPRQDRYLTMREGARLCGYPDEFVFATNKSGMARYADATQAVMPAMGEFFGRVFNVALDSNLSQFGEVEIIDWRPIARPITGRAYQRAKGLT